MELTILSKKLVKPVSPTPQNLRNLPISCLDQLYASSYVPIVLFYAPNADGVGASEESSQRKRLLEDSLARVLSLYYPLAGRYMSDEYEIDCNDEGVELLEAKVNCKLSEFISGNCAVDKLNLLALYEFLPPTSPLLTIQLTMFDCGGIAIGMAYTHRIMDGGSSSEFIRGWSVACSQGTDKVECPSFGLASVLTTARDRLLVVPTPQAMQAIAAGQRIVTKRFLFNLEAIRTLKSLANNDNDDQCRGKYSRGQVVLAFIWTVFIRVYQAKNGGNLRPSLLSLSANMRDKVKISIPPNSFGNFLIPSLAKFVPENGKSNVNFAELASLLRDTIRSTVNQCAQFTGGDDIVTGLANAWKESVCGNDVDTLTVTNWCNLSYYEADFGWGKPIRVSNLPPPIDKFVILLDTKDKTGIEASVSLEEEDMILFQENPDTKALAIAL